MENIAVIPAAEQTYYSEQFHNQTLVEPLGFAVFFVSAVALLLVKRRAAMFPYLIVLSLIAMSQRVVIGGLDFTFLRLLILVGGVRVLLRNEGAGLRLHLLDGLMITSILYGYAIEALRSAAYVKTLGNLLDALGIYLLCRILIRGWGELDQLGKYASIVAILIAPFFVIEWQTGRNYFSLLGGVAEYSQIHHGRMRAKGAFAHMILAGCFWATLMPLMAARWWNPRASKGLVVAGLLASMAVVISTASSTPILAMVATIGAACLFPVRSHLRWFRWSFAGILLVLHFAMNAPVWHLIARVGVFGGSTGWHRFNLIDKFIANFDEWWLIGTDRTAHWGHQLQDVTNEFIIQAIHGGLLNLILYIAMLVAVFNRLGVLIDAVQKNRPMLAFAWALGVAMFAHTVVHFGVGYFGQMPFALYATVAATASLTAATVSTAAPRGSPRIADRHAKSRLLNPNAGPRGAEVVSSKSRQ